MLSTENAVIEILPGSANDSTAAEVYRNLQVLYATRAGEQALDREFGIDGTIIDARRKMRKSCWRRSMCARQNSMSHGRVSSVWNGLRENRRTEI